MEEECLAVERGAYKLVTCKTFGNAFAIQRRYPRSQTFYTSMFGRLQYSKTEGEGLGNLTMRSIAQPSYVITPPLYSHCYVQD